MFHFRIDDLGLTVLEAHIFSFISLVRESPRSLLELAYSLVAIVLFVYLVVSDLAAASGGGWAMDLVVTYCEALLWPIYLLLR